MFWVMRCCAQPRTITRAFAALSAALAEGARTVRQGPRIICKAPAATAERAPRAGPTKHCMGTALVLQSYCTGTATGTAVLHTGAALVYCAGAVLDLHWYCSSSTRVPYLYCTLAQSQSVTALRSANLAGERGPSMRSPNLCPKQASHKTNMPSVGGCESDAGEHFRERMASISSATFGSRILRHSLPLQGTTPSQPQSS